MNNSVGNIDGDLAVVYNITSNEYYGIFEYSTNNWIVAVTDLTTTARDVLSPIVFQR